MVYFCVGAFQQQFYGCRMEGGLASEGSGPGTWVAVRADCTPWIQEAEMLKIPFCFWGSICVKKGWDHVVGRWPQAGQRCDHQERGRCGRLPTDPEQPMLLYQQGLACRG